MVDTGRIMSFVTNIYFKYLYFRAELLTHPHMDHCYISRLTVKGVQHTDSRKYLVTVTNMHGSDAAPVHLTVRGTDKCKS